MNVDDKLTDLTLGSCCMLQGLKLPITNVMRNGKGLQLIPDIIAGLANIYLYQLSNFYQKGYKILEKTIILKNISALLLSITFNKYWGLHYIYIGLGNLWPNVLKIFFLVFFPLYYTTDHPQRACNADPWWFFYYKLFNTQSTPWWC